MLPDSVFQICGMNIITLEANVIIIGLITVFNAILTSRQTGLKLQCLYGNPMSNNFHKTLLLKNS